MPDKLKPILFSGEMVRAILDGRKTQTRRHAKFSDIYRLTDERITAIHSNDEIEIAAKTDSGITERRLPSGERREDLLSDALRWIWSQGARGLVCVGRQSKREGIFDCFLVPQEQESDKISSSVGMYGVSWYAANSGTPDQTLEREQAGQPTGESSVGNAIGKLDRPPRAWHCNGWGEALGIKIIRRAAGSYSLRRNNGAMFPPPRRTSLGDVTICHFRNLPWMPRVKIWVKETFSATGAFGYSGRISYRADVADGKEPHGLYWKPSIFMPRKASRITLEIVSVRVERVQDIGKDGRKAKDVLAEGITDQQIENWCKWLHPDDAPAHAYGQLWESINGKGSWAKNDYVWVIEFKRV